MSNDLISRKEVIKRFEEVKEKADTLRDKAYLTGVLAIIDCIPTAYDIDAVCDELEKFTKGECTLHECGIRSERCSECMAGKAVEIVRNGGRKNENQRQ